MTIEEAKAELRSYKDLLHSNRLLEIRIGSLREGHQAAVNYAAPRVDGGNMNDSLVSLIQKISDLTDELERSKAVAQIRLARITLKISQLPYPYTDILNLIYIEQWNAIRAMRKLGYSDSGFNKNKRKAIVAYSNLN